MKFTVSFKTPDVMEYALAPYVGVHCEQHEEFDNDCDECCNVDCEAHDTCEEMNLCAYNFIEYGECITVEFDTDDNTATVLPIRKRTR
jgi:hypothetical protein